MKPKVKKLKLYLSTYLSFIKGGFSHSCIQVPEMVLGSCLSQSLVLHSMLVSFSTRTLCDVGGLPPCCQLSIMLTHKFQWCHSYWCSISHVPSPEPFTVLAGGEASPRLGLGHVLTLGLLLVKASPKPQVLRVGEGKEDLCTRRRGNGGWPDTPTDVYQIEPYKIIDIEIYFTYEKGDLIH